jgi:hypothetical protein
MVVASGMAVVGLTVLLMLLMWDPSTGYASQDTCWP